MKNQYRDLKPASAEAVGLYPEGLDRVDAVVRELVEQGRLAGAVTLVARRVRLVRVQAMGMQDLTTGTSMREDSIFRIFSMTKPVTATAMMILHDEGRWRPQDAIARHLPFRASPIPDHDRPPSFALGGGGLVSTAPDYARYAQMLLNGGEFAGRRIVSTQAVRQQMSNWLSPQMMQAGYLARRQHIRPGVGFGYNGVVFTDPALAGIPVGRGTYHWDGAAGTWFWVDPANDLLYVGMIQQLLSERLPPLQALTQTLMAQAILNEG